MTDRIAGRILVIDDDIDLLMLLERTLQKHNYVVETAASLAEGKELLDIFYPDLILLDINLKGEDGRQLCWTVKNSNKKFCPTVILMSGYDYSTSIATLFGADDFISKPIITDYLLYRIEEFLSVDQD